MCIRDSLLAILIILSSMGTGLMLYFILALVMPLSADGSGSLTATEVDGTSTELTFPGPSAAPIGAEPPAFTPDEVQRWDLPGARNLNGVSYTHLADAGRSRCLSPSGASCSDTDYPPARRIE